MTDQSTFPTKDGWWLSSQGAPTGPHDPAFILAGLKTGAISPQTNACPVGGQEWKQLAEWPLFVPARRQTPPPPPPEPNARPASRTTPNESYFPYQVTLIVIFALGSLTIGLSYLFGLCFIAIGVSICNFIAGKNNKWGTAPLDRSIMILAVVSLVPYLGWLTQIAALVLSIIALRKYKAAPPEHKVGQLREPWLLYGGLLWGIGLTVCGIGLMVEFVGVQSGYRAGAEFGKLVGSMIVGFISIGALAWTCFGLLDKYVIHRGQAAVLRPRVRLFAWIFGVTVLLGFVLLPIIIFIARLVVTAGMERTEAVPEVVKARQFLLVDENGKERAGLSMGKDGPVLVLVDENGKERAGLSMGKDGPGLALMDENEKPRAVLGMGKDGVVLSLMDENGKQGAVLRVKKVEGSFLGLRDENGKTRAGLKLDKQFPQLFLADENGQIRAAMAVINDAALLGLKDENGEDRATLGVAKQGPWLTLTDENGKHRAQMVVVKEGPFVALMDENGRVLQKLPE